MFFAGLIGNTGSAGLADADSGLWRSFLGSGRNSSGVRVTPETAMALPIIQNCVTLLAESTAQLPCEVFERQGDGRRVAAIHHPAYDVLRYQPNPFQTPYERLELLQMAVGLRGNGYEFIERREDGNISALWPLATEKTQVLKGPDLLPYYRIHGVSEPLPMRMIHHVRWVSHNGYIGLSPIDLHAEAVGLAQAVRHYTGKSFANGVTVSGVIERPKEVNAIKDQSTIDKIVGQWGEKFGGIDNAKKVALLQEGMTFKPVSMNNVDAEMVSILKLSGVDVARIYKIPLPMVNDLDKASDNTVEQLLIMYVVFGLLPWIKRHEQSMMRDFLLPQDRKSHFIEFNLSGLLRGDQKTRYEAYAIGRQWGWLSVNDIRRLENLPPIDGGDVYLQPLNMVDAKNGAAPGVGGPMSATDKSKLEPHLVEIEQVLKR